MSTLENRRFFLIALLGMVLFFSFQAYEKDQRQKLAAQQASNPAIAQAAAKPAVSTGDAIAAPSVTADAAATPTAAEGLGAAAPLSNASYEVVTDKLRVRISAAGGDLRRVELLDYQQTKAKGSPKLALLTDEDPHFFIIQSGLAGADQPLTSATTLYTATSPKLEMAEGQNRLDLVLRGVDARGLPTTKTWRFTRGSHQVELVQTLQNTSAAPVLAASYARMQRTTPYTGDQPPFSQTFSGVGYYEKKPDEDGYRFKKVALDNLEDDAFEVTQTGGWVSMLQHYFLTAILPPQDQKATFSAKPSTVKGYLAQYYGPLQTIAPQQTSQFATRFYIGPITHGTLDEVAPGLELAEDYGILTPIATPLFWIMKTFYNWVGNWGIAIILLTLTVKALMYKLSEAQFRSMAKMKKFAPRIADIKERYAGDKERLNKAMMELYTKEGFNPLAGCWPLLVQFPVFIALYWVLAQAVELRQADFGLWINDLSSPDPFYVLPVLFGLSMWAQQKLQGSMVTMDPMQQKMMQFMPIALTAFFAFFPAGLVLYWFVSNLVTIAQQWYINKKVEAEGKLEQDKAQAKAAQGKAVSLKK